MPINTTSITSEQTRQILEFEEGHFIDLKSADITPSKLTHTISAFANADGGELYIGIDENTSTRVRSWRGFRNEEAANAHLQVFEQIFPLGQYFLYSFLSCPSNPGLVLHVDVRKTPDIKKSSDGTIYLRRGAQNLPKTTEDAIRHLQFNKGITSFETELV